MDWQPGDVCAFVLDKDRWPDKTLSRLAQEAVDNDAILALSHPCFEYWILLHFSGEADIPVDRKALKSMVRSRRDQMSTRNFEKTLIENVHHAMDRAEALDVDLDARWPTTCGSRVYRLMRRMLMIQPVEKMKSEYALKAR